MIKVGVTGGIGSGKSLVCSFFKLIGIPVYEADYEAKQLMNSSSVIKSQLMKTFGDDIYLPNSTVDRKKLAGIVFNSPSSLKKVNEIIHPEVRKHFNEWVDKQDSEYIVYEAAILFESGFYTMMDFLILVTSPVETRIQRVMARDGVSREDVLARINKQWDDADKIKRSNLVLTNDDTELIIPQLIELDNNLRRHG